MPKFLPTSMNTVPAMLQDATYPRAVTLPALRPR